MSEPKITRGWTVSTKSERPSGEYFTTDNPDDDDRTCVLIWTDDHDAMIFERNEFERLAKEWEAEYDKLKAKYEPTFLGES